MSRADIHLPSVLADLTNVQRERLRQGVDTLTQQGVGPGDAWQVVSTRQRQADLPAYAPTADERETLNRAAQQLGGESPAVERSPVRLTPDISGTAASSGDGSSDSGIKQMEEAIAQPEQPESQQLVETEPAIAFSEPPKREAEASGEASDETASQDDMAQDILDNARRFLDTAIAAGVIDESLDEVRAVNERYIASRSRAGVVTVKNQATQSIAVGDEAGGVERASGLTPADQEAWHKYGQVSVEQLQQQEQQEQRRQQRPAPDLEL
ncbi:hypothetical protein [Sphaerothrix gracilis]|uniref:hypothetical protein n=1 Tax=Sphaerothrix gracilis TaxID=3151835 RepID=UPI0031FBC078